METEIKVKNILVDFLTAYTKLKEDDDMQPHERFTLSVALTDNYTKRIINFFNKEKYDR